MGGLFVVSFLVVLFAVAYIVNRLSGGWLTAFCQALVQVFKS